MKIQIDTFCKAGRKQVNSDLLAAGIDLIIKSMNINAKWHTHVEVGDAMNVSGTIDEVTIILDVESDDDWFVLKCLKEWGTTREIKEEKQFVEETL